jgi:hypothetical protein
MLGKKRPGHGKYIAFENEMPALRRRRAGSGAALAKRAKSG